MGNCTTLCAVIKNKRGLHARPSTMIARRCGKYNGRVYLSYSENPKQEEDKYECRDVMSMMAMEAGPGKKVYIHAEGEDLIEAKNIVKWIYDLLSMRHEEAITAYEAQRNQEAVSLDSSNFIG